MFDLAVQPDGKILVAGDFVAASSENPTRIARLHADGTLDGTFDAGRGANANVRTLSLQADGALVVGGRFTAVDEMPVAYLARLNGDRSRPVLEYVKVPPGNSASLNLLGKAGTRYTVESSADLLQWEAMATVTIPQEGQAQIEPTTQARPFIFYRAVSTP